MEDPSDAEVSLELTGASNIAAHLSVTEKLLFATKTLAVTVPCLLWDLMYDLLFRTREVFSRPFRMTMLKCALKASKLTLREQRAIAKPTGVIITNYCRAKELRHDKVLLVNTDASCAVEGAEDNVNVDQGEEVDMNGPSTTAMTLRTTTETPRFQFLPAMLHFVGSQQGKKVLVYFHGGGYTMPLTTGQLRFARLAAEKSDMSLVVLEYTLSPQLNYPGQLAQAAAALRYLLKQRPASDIIIMGDSAGANMCLGLLAHLQHPHPQIQPVFTSTAGRKDTTREQQKLGGALIISPRCANTNEAASYRYNRRKDIISGRSIEDLNKVTENWDIVMSEVWNAPLAGGEEFWSDIMAHRLLLTVGGDEVYVDDVKEFGCMIGAKDRDEQPNAQRQLVVCPGELHVQAILDVALSCTHGRMLDSVLGWLQEA